MDELEIIPTEWSQEERLLAMQFLKETDCLSALLGDSTAPDNSLPLSRLLASLLLKDPIKRLEAIEKSALEVVPFLSQNARMIRDRESDLESDPIKLDLA